MSDSRPSADQQLLARVRAAMPPLAMSGQRVLVAVSGGPDSVALLMGLHEVRAEFGLELVAAHVHHGWRGAEADADAQFVVDLGIRLQLTTDVLPITPEQKAVHAEKSIEEAARDARYELLIEAAQRHNCSRIAVGHTADDQVETVLHHILRGTGLAGLAGMPSERLLTPSIRLVRPLLAASRGDVLSFLRGRNQVFCVDATNADAALTRNRLRNELLPLLRDQFNPQVAAALLRLADQAAETTAVVEALAERLLTEALLEETDAVCRLDARRLAAQPEALVRQTLRRLWIRRNWPRQAMGRREWERLARLVHSPGAIDLPGGLSARRETGPLIIGRR